MSVVRCQLCGVEIAAGLFCASCGTPVLVPFRRVSPALTISDHSYLAALVAAKSLVLPLETVKTLRRKLREAAS